MANGVTMKQEAHDDDDEVLAPTGDGRSEGEDDGERWPSRQPSAWCVARTREMRRATSRTALVVTTWIIAPPWASPEQRDGEVVDHDQHQQRT